MEAKRCPETTFLPREHDPIALPINTLAEQLRAACLLECTAPKPGNVCPGASFVDVTYADFVRSAEVSSEWLALSGNIGIGQALVEAVQATRNAVGTNTNLGMLLLLAPLAAVPPGVSLRAGIGQVLRAIDLPQTALIFQAIRLAQPGGLGTAAEEDVQSPPSVSIVEAMSLAPQDRIAWQYTHEFADVLGVGRDVFLRSLREGADWSVAVVRTHVELIARHSDSLILRKCGAVIAAEAQRQAREVLEQWTDELRVPAVCIDFDRWLRQDGHRRNPGTTADLVAGVLFGVIREGDWTPPPKLE